METWDAIRARRNVRTYTDDPLAGADLDRILEAGWRAPSASNRQHWDFVVVTDRTQLGELSTVWRGAGHIAGAAAAIALVLPEPPDERSRVVDQYDIGQATYAIMLAATDLGIGTGHSSVGDQDKARAILGVPDDHFVAYLIGLGYPAGPWRPSPSPTAAPWTRWYTGVAGSRPGILQDAACRGLSTRRGFDAQRRELEARLPVHELRIVTSAEG